MNRIQIQGLQVTTHIGVPAEERAVAQMLEVDVEMTPAQDFATMDDDVGQTIDYQAVSLAIQDLAAGRSRQLIETLAADVAALVRRDFGATQVQVRIRKFILPETRWVGVSYASGV